jgi:hypothetical protein
MESCATLAGALEDLRQRGYARQFAVAGDRLRDLADGQTFTAEDLRIREYHRFEGVSDPDDMSIVYAIESRSGARGTLVDAFGAYSDPAVSAFLEAVPIQGTP